MDGQAKAAADFFRESLHLLGLYSFSAIHTQGQADHDLGHPVVADDLLQLRKIESLVLPVKRFQSLCGNAELVGNGQPDPLRTYIQAQNSRRTPRHRRIGLVRRHLAIICRTHIFAIKLRYRYGH